MSKKILKLLLVFLLLLIYMYVLSWQNIPDNLVVFEGEKINLKTIIGMKINTNQKIIETSTTNNAQLTRRSRQKNSKNKFIQ